MGVDGYVRVSQVRGRSGDSFISPAVQREKIEAYCRLHGTELLNVYEELDESGARRDRPKLLEAVERVERGESGGIVVARLDRFGRSLVDSLSAIERVQSAGGVFASVADGFDISTDTGRLVLRIMLSLAEFELDRVRGNFSDARARAVARGLHPSPVPPFGYSRPTDENGRVVGPLTPDPATAPLVHELFERAARGESWARLARWLEEEAAVTAYGAATWTARAVKDVVRNRVYLGEARHGEFVKADAHEPLTDELTFQQAQRTGRAFPPSRSKDGALLSGLLRCAGCRHGMQSYMGPKGREYRCHRRYAVGVCEAPAYVHASVIEPYVEQTFLEAVGNLRAEDPPIDTAELRDLEAAMRAADAEFAMFRDSASIAELGEEHFVAGLRARRAALDQAQEAYLAARAEAEPARSAALPDRLHELWPDLNVQERRELLSAAIDAVFLRRGRNRHAPISEFAWVCFRGEAPDDLPRRGIRRGMPLKPFVFPRRRQAGTTDAPERTGH